MRTTLLTCLSIAALLSGCAPSPDGYYDANGNWVAISPANPKVAQNHAPLGTTRDEYEYGNHYNSYYNTPAPYTTTSTTVYSYDRAGYYAPDGTYVGPDYVVSGSAVPADMLPPRGMCRVWFSTLAPSDQPAIESCSGIRARVPAGAYVIYGG